MYLLNNNILLKNNINLYNNINYCNNYCNNINMIITPEIYLSTSIILETFSTICLKNTIENKLWYIPSYCGYAISFGEAFIGCALNLPDREVITKNDHLRLY